MPASSSISHFAIAAASFKPLQQRQSPVCLLSICPFLRSYQPRVVCCKQAMVVGRFVLTSPMEGLSNLYIPGHLQAGIGEPCKLLPT